jgi:hypothetical protein
MNRRSEPTPNDTCTVPGCGNTQHAHGLCGGHYQRRSRGETVDVPLRKRTRMTAELQQRIYDLRSQGLSQPKIAEQLGIGRGSVFQALQATGDPYQPPDPLCIVEWCQRDRHSSLGYCVAHLYRYERGLPLEEPFASKEKQPDRCTAPGCDRQAYSLGYCNTHASQYRKHKQVRPIRNLWDEVTYHAAHRRCTALWGPASGYPCVDCGNAAADWAYDGTDPTQLEDEAQEAILSIRPYSLYPEFYLPMCKACHKKRDLKKLNEVYREWLSEEGSADSDEPPF